VPDFALGFEPVFLVVAVGVAALLEPPVSTARYLVVAAIVLIRHRRVLPRRTLCSTTSAFV